MTETTKTDYATRCEILGEFWISHKDHGDYADFVEYNDLGLPLAYAISKEIVHSTAKAEMFINETFDILLAALDEEDTGFEHLADLLGELD